MTKLALLLPLLALAAVPARAADPATNAPIAGEALCDAMPKLNSCEHLFSAQTPGMDFICLEGWPNDPNTTNQYCAVFTNGALSRIVSSPILPQRPGYPQGSPALDPESFVQLVLASTNRVPTETVLKRDAETDNKPQHVDWGLTAAFLAVRVACAPFSAEPAQEDDAPSDKSSMETMNPLMVRLGMDRTTLEERIGPPRFSRQTKASETIYYYGRPPKSIYNEGRCWLGIRYESNAVIRVYTGLMLDHSAIDNFQL